MRIKVKVKPRSGKQEIVKIEEDNYLVYLKNSPEDNKANIELLNFLKKYFRKKIKIVRGAKNKNKILEIE